MSCHRARFAAPYWRDRSTSALPRTNANTPSWSTLSSIRKFTDCFADAVTPSSKRDSEKWRPKIYGVRNMSQESTAPRQMWLRRGLALFRGAVANDIEAITVLIESGLYLGYLPTHHVAALPASKNLLPLGLESADCEVPLYLYHRKGARRLSSVRMFLDELQTAKELRIILRLAVSWSGKGSQSAFQYSHERQLT